jgi:hypothetical protein
MSKSEPRSDLLEGVARQLALRRKWMELWDKIGTRLMRMPTWMQQIVLEDINTAILNRLAVMELVEKAKNIKADSS